MRLTSYSPYLIRVEDAHADVWKFNIDKLYGQYDSLFSFMTEDETIRYEKLVDYHKQRSHMACRGLLRLVVSLYTKQDPKQIQFSYGSYGKPFILGQPNCLFNLTHSGNWLYIIVSKDYHVGIDCENLNLKNVDNLASYILNPIDYAQFKDLPKQSKTKSLIQAWTQKEAFIKAIGKGLFYQSLKDIKVDISCSVNINITNDYDGITWITKTLNISDDHITSICYEKGEILDESCNSSF